MQSILSLWQKLWGKKVTRFFFVGCFNTALDFTIFNVLILVFNLPVVVATTVSISIGISVSYVLNHKIVFRNKQELSFKKYLHFFAITGFSVIIVQNLVIWAVTHIVVVQEGQGVQVAGHFISAETIEVNIAKVFAVLFGMCWNFLLYKYVIFKHGSKEEAEEDLTLA